MKKLLLSVFAFAGLALSQSAPSHAWNCFPEATMTDDAYWAHQPAAVRILREDPSTAMQLAQQGYTIDVAIMVWHWDPVCTMGLRKQEGYTWVPSALQANVPTTPGNDLPGIPPYDPNHPPAGSIKVSTDIADYAPLDPPTPPAVVPSANIVGPCYAGAGIGGKTICSAGIGFSAVQIKDGQQVLQGGHTYLSHITQGLIGVTVWFEQQQ